MEALLVAAICSPRRVSASAPAFASFHLHCPGHAWSSASLRWWMLCRRSGLADALPLSSRWLKFALGGCFAAVVVDRVDALPPLLGRRPSPLEEVVFACRFSCRVVSRCVGCALCHFRFTLLLFVLLLCFLVCVCVFQCFSIFSPLCSCVGQALLGHFKIVSVTAFYLMKNMLRYGHEKNMEALHLLL
jgi:hypothetical protein